jgi:hypothetical protein
LPKSARAAVTVEETGFHAAIAPSQAGINDGATDALEIPRTGTRQ